MELSSRHADQGCKTHRWKKPCSGRGDGNGYDRDTVDPKTFSIARLLCLGARELTLRSLLVLWVSVK